MKHLLQENRNAFLLLLGLSFILVFTIYLFFYRPLNEELQKVEARERTLQREIAALEALEQDVAPQDERMIATLENSRFRKKIPDSPEIERILLTLNEIELVSNSKIYNVGFDHEGYLPEITQIDHEQAEFESDGDDDESKEEETTEDIDDRVGVQKSVINITEMPEGLHSINVTLEITSPTYEQFQALLKEIEIQERVFIVTNLEFTRPVGNEPTITEDENEVEVDDTISAIINFTTFYYDS